MRLHVADHPLITHKLTVLRDQRTSSPVFRQLTEELVTLLAYEATRNVRVESIEIQTPVTTTTGVKIGDPRADGTLVGPLIDKAAFDGMERALDEARAAGGTVHGGGRYADAPGEGFLVCKRFKSDDQLAAHPDSGRVFSAPVDVPGLPVTP